MSELDPFRPGLRRLRATATPVDTYVRPQAEAEPVRPPSTNTFTQLADALRTVEPRLNQYLDARFQDYTREQEAEGIKAQLEGSVSGLETNRLGWKALIDRTREEDPEAADRLLAMSPHFKRGFQRAQADSMGIQFYDALLSEWGTNPEVTLPSGETVSLQGTDDPNALSSWLTSRTQSWMEQNGVSDMDETIVAEVLLPRMRQVQGQLASRHSEFRLKEQRAEYGRELSQNAQLVISTAAASGDYAAGVSSLQDRLDAAIIDGVPPREANETIVQAVIAEARAANDPTILSMLEGLTTGNGSLGSIAWVSSAAQSAKDVIINRGMQLERHNAWRRDQARSETSRAIMAEVYPQIMADPTADIGAYRDQLIQIGMPEAATQLDALQHRYLTRERAAVTVDRDASAIRDRIYRARSSEDVAEIRSDIAELAADGRLAFRDAERLYDELSRTESQDDLRSNPYVSRLRSEIQTRVDRRFADMGMGDDRGRSAGTEMMRRLNDWVSSQEAPPSEALINAEADRIADSVLGSPAFIVEEGVQRAPVSSDAASRVEQATGGDAPDQLEFEAASILSQPRGSISFGTTTMPGALRNQLMTEHFNAPNGSLLSQIASQHGLEVEALARAITGEERPFETPQERDARITQEREASEEAARPVELQIDEQSLASIESLLDASFGERNFSTVDLLDSPLVQDLVRRGIVQERTVSTGRRRSASQEQRLEVDYDAGLEAVAPYLVQFGQQAGVDGRLLSGDTLTLPSDDPLAIALSEAGFGSVRTSRNRSAGRFTLGGPERLEAILHLITQE